MGKGLLVNKVDLVVVLYLEMDFEKELFCYLMIIEGMYWGVLCYGYLEGEVYKYVQEVLVNIDKFEVDI